MGIVLRPVLSILLNPRSFLATMNQLFPPHDQPLCRLFSDLNVVQLDHETMLKARVGYVWSRSTLRNLWARSEEMCRMQVPQWKTTSRNFTLVYTNKHSKRKGHALQQEHAEYLHHGRQHPRQEFCLCPWQEGWRWRRSKSQWTERRLGRILSTRKIGWAVLILWHRLILMYPDIWKTSFSFAKTWNC